LKKGVKKIIIKKKKERKRIIIITRRPSLAAWITKIQLRFYGVPFDIIRFVGPHKGHNERKLKIIKDMGIKVFYDNDPIVIKFFSEKGIRVISYIEMGD